MRIIVCSASLLAFGGATQLEGVSELVSSLTTGSVLIWYLWFSESKTRPQYLAELSRAREDYLAALKDQRSQRAEELREIFENSRRD